MHLKNLKIVFLSFIFIISGNLQLEAQMPVQQDQSYMIAGISVEGNVYADEQTIRSLLGFQAGDQINLAGDTKIQQAIKNLWGRGQFSDVEIEVESVTPSGIFLMVRVKELPRINEIRIEGNDELSRDDIIKAIDKMPGNIVSAYDLYLIEKRIKDLYREEEGFQFTKVDTELEPAPQKELFYNLIIEIEEGLEFYVNSIEFKGNEILESDDLEDSFEETQTKSWWQVWKSSKFNPQDYEKDLVLLKQYMQNQGFIDAQVISDTVIYNEDEQTVNIVVEVEEGDRVFIRDIEFRGNTVFTEDVLMRRLDVTPGDAYNVQQFNENLRGNQKQTDAASLYYNSGYLTANFEPEVIRIGRDSVDIVVNIFENDRFRIRRVDIAGNSKTHDKVIRRELYTYPGSYFDRSAIIRSIQSLGVLNYFNPEALQPQIIPVDNTSVDLIYNVEETSTDTFNASIGYAGSWGFTISAGFTFNNFSILEPLKGGAGQIFNFNYEYGEANRYNTFSIGFTEPWLFNKPTTLGFNLFSQSIKYNSYELDRTGASMNIGRRLKWPDDYFRADWSAKFQFNDLGETTTASRYYKSGTEYNIGQRISRISLDNLFFATSGSKMSLSNNWAMGAIGVGETDFLKSQLDLEFYNPLFKVGGQNRVVLYLGSNFGYVTGFKSDTAISPIDLYYMGGNGLSMLGVTPLRGYDDQDVGPRDETGQPIGGTVMARYIAELRFAVSVNPMPIYFYGFAEAGNVWDGLSNTDPFDLKRSAGVGVKMLLNPIGIIGFSYGYGFDPPAGSLSPSGWKFLFHLGQ